MANGNGARTITDEVYEYIFQKIVNCEYPPGYELNAKDIAEETGFGMTPIRESLLILQKTGMLKIQPRKGIMITPITERRAREMFQIRRLVEPTIMVENCHLYPKKDLYDFYEKFEHDNERTDYERFVLDVEFHKYMISIVDNKRLNEIYDDLMASQVRSAVYEALHNTDKHKDENIRQHHEIIEALLKENKQWVRDIMMMHLSYAENNILRALAEDEQNGGKK